MGARVSSEIDTLSFSPGYQYDLIRRNRGYLAIATQVYLLNTKASLAGTASVNGVSITRTASGSFFAPCPVTGLQGRLYWLRSSRRLSVDGSAQGMTFFGYGNLVTARGTFGVAMSRHWNLLMGYQMGTRLSIHGDTNRIGIRLVQKGPVVGLETSW